MRFLMLLAATPMLVWGAVVSQLPPCEYADTEVSTNLPFSVDLDTMTRVEFILDIVASPTNAVEVSLGCDANGDGNLDPYEADWAFGSDCGRWFSRNVPDDMQSVEPEMRCGNVRKTFVIRRGRLDTAWNLVKVIKRGHGTVFRSVSVEGRKPGYILEIR